MPGAALQGKGPTQPGGRRGPGWPAPRAERPEGTAESLTTSVPQCPQLRNRATPRPSALRHGRQEAKSPPRGWDWQTHFLPSAESPYSTPVAKAMALPSSVVRVRLMTTGTTAILGEKQRSRGTAAPWPPRCFRASQIHASPLPRQPGAGRIPRDQLGHMHDWAALRPQTPINLFATFCAFSGEKTQSFHQTFEKVCDPKRS